MPSRRSQQLQSQPQSTSVQHYFDQWMPSSAGSSPSASLSPTLAFASPLLSTVGKGVKGAFDRMMGPTGFGWSPILGLGGAFDDDVNAFASLSVQDAVDSAPSEATSSPAYTLPPPSAHLDLPAWCTELPTRSLSQDSADDFLHPEATVPQSQPARRLRRTGNRKTRLSSEDAANAASPDFEGGSDVRSVLRVDPYLQPTQANRLPLRQYVSAPELQSPTASQVAAYSGSHRRRGSGNGLLSSESMDDFLSSMGWGGSSSGGTGATHDMMATGSDMGGNYSYSYQHAGGSSAPSQSYSQEAGPSSFSAGLPYNVRSTDEGEGPHDLGQSEIDGSLYKRRANRNAEMPAPMPISTHTDAASQQQQQQQQQHFNVNVGHGQSPRVSGIASAPLGSNQAGGQAALRRNTQQGMSAYTLPGQEEARQQAATEQQQQQQQTSPEQSSYSHYLLYSNGVPSASPYLGGNTALGPAGFTSTYPTAAPAQNRQRNQSVPTGPGQFMNSLQLSGVPSYAMRQAPVVSQAEAATVNPAAFAPTHGQPPHHSYPASVPLFPTHLPPTVTATQGASSAASAAAPPLRSSNSDPWTASGAPMATSPAPWSASSASTASSELQANMPKTPTMPKHTRSSPNLRGTPPSAGGKITDVTSQGSPTPSPRKIAGTRRVQSSNNLRKKKSCPAFGVGSPNQAQTSPPFPAGGFSFVNYGVEDAQELCAAVAPSGSYKIPLKGYGTAADGTPLPIPLSTSGGGGGGLPYKAPSAPVKSKPRPRAYVDNSRWIQETGEDSDEESDSDDDGEGAAAAAAAAAAARKRRKSEAAPSKGGNRLQRKKSAL